MSNNIDKPKTNIVTADNYGMEYLFLHVFFENTDLYSEFSIIAHEFLKHEFSNLEQYHYIDYGADTPREAPKTLYINMKILSLIYQAAKKGSEYSKNLLVYLYKTYYRREYNELRRYEVINSEEAYELTRISWDKGKSDLLRYTRIFVMAPFVGVEVGDIDGINSAFDDMWKQYQRSRHAVFEKTIPADVMDKCTNQVLDWLDDCEEPFSKKDMPYWWRTRKLACESFAINGYTEGYVTDRNGDDIECAEEQYNMIRTLAILEMNFPNTDFSFKDVQIYSIVYMLVNKMMREMNCTNIAINDLLGISREYAVDKPKRSLFRPESVTGKAGLANVETDKIETSKVETLSKNVEITDENDAYQNLMLAEIERLRVKLHNAEQENLGLREKNNELRGLSDSVRILSRQHENDRKELHALREHVYKSTEEETDTREVDIAGLEKAIAEKKIVIIGGRDKWVNKLKAKFGGWRFISTDLSAIVDLKIFDGADFTYFFTEYIAHQTYSAYVKALRERNLPFGYIHCTNVEMNVRQIYEEVVGK